MDYLWTPWRMAYITGQARRPGCLFCHLTTRRPRPREILREGRHGFLILNTYPYTSGHVMAVPYRHVEHLSQLRKEEAGELWSLILQAERALVRAYAPLRIHAGINIGRCAGAGVEGHLHVHLVPRHPQELTGSGEASPVPPEELQVTRRRLLEALGEVGE
jgi:ATP adenylyltransferase